MLDTGRPVSSVELGQRLALTPRQVNYGMHGVRAWLQGNKCELNTQTGVGFSIPVGPARAQALTQQLDTHAGVRIALSISQRQQLLVLVLLTQSEPLIVSQLEALAQISRTTVLKDLDVIESWLAGLRIGLIRRQHFGIQVRTAERLRQQALARLLWGETSFSGDRITTVTHSDGLVFELQGSAHLLPLAGAAATALAQINLRMAVGLIARAEEQLDGRFVDDAVRHLALVLGIQACRMQSGHHSECDDAQLQQAQASALWPVAKSIAQALARATRTIWRPSDIAAIAMELLAAPRNDPLPGGGSRNGEFEPLMRQLLDDISSAFGLPGLKHDRALQQGLLSSVVPACFRQRFDLWLPESLAGAGLPERCEREAALADALAKRVFEHTAVALPPCEITSLVLLLRATLLRNQTPRFERVTVICPSGMATAQLLVARLHSRFPDLSNLEVVSLRDLTPLRARSADLILTTVPLPRQYANNPKVIQVHPLLAQADVEAIASFLS